MQSYILHIYQGERDNALFLHCRNSDSLAVFLVAHFDPHMADRHLASMGRADDRFVVSGFGLSYTFSKTNFSLILEVSRNLLLALRMHTQCE